MRITTRTINNCHMFTHTHTHALTHAQTQFYIHLRTLLNYRHLWHTVTLFCVCMTVCVFVCVCVCHSLSTSVSALTLPTFHFGARTMRRMRNERTFKSINPRIVCKYDAKNGRIISR